MDWGWRKSPQNRALGAGPHSRLEEESEMGAERKGVPSRSGAQKRAMPAICLRPEAGSCMENRGLFSSQF